jgi:hypothetical protein
VVLEDGEEEDDETDADDDPPESARPTVDRKTVTVSLGDTSFSIPLFVKGSSVKPAKKIEDGAHAELSTMAGHKLRFEIRIGDGGQIEIGMTVVRPR